jgi:hypothetical protein
VLILSGALNAFCDPWVRLIERILTLRNERPELPLNIYPAKLLDSKCGILVHKNGHVSSASAGDSRRSKLNCCQIQDHELGQYLPCPLLIKIGLILECSSIHIFHALYSCIVIFTKLSRNFSYMENMLFSFSFSEASGSQLLLAATYIQKLYKVSHIRFLEHA